MQIGTIERPVMRLNQGEIVWDLTAEMATVTADKEHVQLLGQVHVERHEPALGHRMEVDTSEVQIEITPQTATTDQAVNMSDGINQLSAIGLDLDMKSSSFKLKEQVKATYAVN
jgi:LPS export ABC transporter protein LptC